MTIIAAVDHPLARRALAGGNFTYMVRPNHDSSNARAARRMAPMRPIPCQIVTGVSHPSFLPHKPATPGPWSAIPEMGDPMPEVRNGTPRPFNGVLVRLERPAVRRHVCHVGPSRALGLLCPSQHHGQAHAETFDDRVELVVGVVPIMVVTLMGRCGNGKQRKYNAD